MTITKITLTLTLTLQACTALTCNKSTEPLLIPKQKIHRGTLPEKRLFSTTTLSLKKTSEFETKTKKRKFLKSNSKKPSFSIKCLCTGLNLLKIHPIGFNPGKEKRCSPIKSPTKAYSSQTFINLKAIETNNTESATAT